MVYGCLEISEQAWGDIEAVVCQVMIGQKSLLLACIHRPPTASQEINEQLLQAIQKICDLPFNQVLICGDFNYRDIDWENSTVGAGDTSDQAKFFDACQDGFLHQHVR